MRKFGSVLLVDDDETSNFITEHTLKIMNVAERINKVTNGEEAINFIQDYCIAEQSDRCPDVVLLDISMPVMDGFQFLEAFSRKTVAKNIKVVMLTSSNNPKDIELSRKWMLTGYITKPLTSAKFFDVFPESKP